MIRTWQIEYYRREPRALITPASDSQGRCRWVPDNDHYPERDAQFNILNAAADLFEACKADDVLWRHYTRCPKCAGTTFCPDALMMAATASSLRAIAIAKARGNSGQ